MKKYGKYITVFALFIGLIVLMGASGQVTLVKRADVGQSTGTKTFANSQVDTVRWKREEGVSAAAFAAFWTDTVSITQVVVLRVIDNTVTARVAGDTITAFSAKAIAANVTTLNAAIVGTVTMAPLADEYWFQVTYAGSNNGAAGTRNVTYKVLKTYSK